MGIDRLLVASLPLLLVAASRADAQSATPTTLPTVEVIGTSPLLGSGIDREKVPANVRTLSADDLRREGPPDLTGSLVRRIPSVGINEVQANPFQPDIEFRGFTASPVLGTPQGLAVYQNGIRINEPFGDTVNWDLVPEVAIERLNLVSNNPVFGLNALGGALAIEMKSGLTFEGLESEIHGGSFGRRAGSVEYGTRMGPGGMYVAGEAVNENGWRDQSPSELRRLYADVAGRHDAVELHLSFAGASNRFSAIGPTPVQLLDQRREAVYTTPQTYKNDLALFGLAATWQVGDTLSVQGNAYYRGFRQHVVNGNTSDIISCAPALCLGDPTTPLFSTAGAPVSDFLGGAVPGTVDRSQNSTDGFGGSLQATHTAPLFDRTNHLVVGGSIDHGAVDFVASSELGTIGTDLYVNGTGVIIAQPGGEIAPVRLQTTNDYYGLFATDTLDLTPALAVTAGARLNIARISLADQLGTSLNGGGRFERLNPAIGATYKLAANATLYAGYSESNRAPTAAELACADPARPCTLEGFLVSDPPLKQVVSHTYEAGLRGAFVPEEAARVTWSLGIFRTDNSDDIINVSSPVVTGRGFFQNAGDTRRQGIETSLAFRSPDWFVHADYTLLDATFRSTLILNSPDNPAASDGLITVIPGDRLPSLPRHRVKLGADYKATPSWTMGVSATIASGQYLRGDESNQNPQIAGYAVVDLHSSYRVADNVEVFALVQNLFDTHYETFGTFFDPTQIPFLGLTDPRTLSPAPPLGAFGGIRITF
jgi:iron complex outermembrane receptor protein